MAIFVCKKCGHLEFGSAPEACPVCWAAREEFAQNDNVFAESQEKSKEGAVKHAPTIKVNTQCALVPEESCVDVVVRVGATLHPMLDNHFIEFVDCYVDDKYVSRLMLGPSVFPAGCFHLKVKGAKVRIVEKCNLHGHWQAESAL
jgi:desulfoferrodoxin-like iron-binding protein